MLDLCRVRCGAWNLSVPHSQLDIPSHTPPTLSPTLWRACMYIIVWNLSENVLLQQFNFGSQVHKASPWNITCFSGAKCQRKRWGKLRRVIKFNICSPIASVWHVCFSLFYVRPVIWTAQKVGWRWWVCLLWFECIPSRISSVPWADVHTFLSAGILVTKGRTAFLKDLEGKE